MTPFEKTYSALHAQQEADARAKSSGKILLEYHPIKDSPSKIQLEEILKILPPLSNSVGPWIAGGAARRLLQGLPFDDGDIDLFFFNQRIWNEFVGALDGFEKVFVSSNAITFLVHGLKVQLIKRRFYESVEAIFEDFDFSICQVAYINGQIATTRDSYLDIQNSRFRLAKHGRTCNQTAMNRFTKYINYGFIPEIGMYPDLIRKALNRATLYDVFIAPINDDNAWYNGAPSEPNQVAYTTPETTSLVFQNIISSLGF